MQKGQNHGERENVKKRKTQVPHDDDFTECMKMDIGSRKLF